MAFPYTPPPTTSPRNDKFHRHATDINTARLPAQDSYFYSAPPSPLHQVIIHQSIPPRKTPSPRPQGGGRTSPNPIYYSPTNPVPSPYSAARPKPRLGFRKRVLAKISAWIHKLFLWAQENPIKAGFLTFAPVLAFAGATKMWLGLGKLLGKGKTGVDKAVKESRKSAAQSRGAKKQGKKSWGFGLDNFVDFNGSKGGPLDGMLKMLQMWV